MASFVKTAIKFIMIKPAENCTQDLLGIGQDLKKDNHDLSHAIP